MGQDDVVLAPDPRLKQVCEPIDTIDDSIKELAEHMLDVMYESSGCGLAAPQIGVNKQICVVDCDWDENTKKNPYVLINPEIIETSDEMVTASEGCLSFPGISVDVERPSRVVVRARNLDGKLMQYEAEGNLLCVCLQHEIDHLKGITMVDHLSGVARLNAMRKYAKAKAAGAKPGDTE